MRVSTALPWIALAGGLLFALPLALAPRTILGQIGWRVETLVGDLRTAMRDKNLRHGGLSRSGQTIEVRLRETIRVQLPVQRPE